MLQLFVFIALQSAEIPVSKYYVVVLFVVL